MLIEKKINLLRENIKERLVIELVRADIINLWGYFEDGVLNACDVCEKKRWW